MSQGENESASDRLKCPYCSKSFRDADARYNHARVKHKGLSLKAIFPEHIKLREKAHATEQRLRAKAERDREPSLADIAVEATWKRAAGLPLDELEWSLLP
jgi:hypothetical protein